MAKGVMGSVAKAIGTQFRTVLGRFLRQEAQNALRYFRSASVPNPRSEPQPAEEVPGSPKPAVEADATSHLIDINSASKADLISLKGIGPARAETIIKGRPYKSAAELVERRIVPDSIFKGIKSHVTARR